MNEQVMVCGKIEVPPMTLQFNEVNTGEFIGKFFEKEGKLHFEGDVDKSAERFIEFVCLSFEQRINEIVEEQVNKRTVANGNNTITLSTTYKVVEPM